MMHFGIPAYRLPRDVLEAEVRRIEEMGVTILLNHKVEDLLAEKEQGNFDAVFVAVGAHLSKRVEIPARDAGRMLDALSFLKDAEAGTAPQLGRRVAVYGGGNTAMDAARVALRLGHEPLIIYRRDREHMPAHQFEADEALEEGVKIHWLRSIKSIDRTEYTVEIMELDENGRPRGTGQFETLEADDLILALGQETDTGFLRDVRGIEFQEDGTVIVDEQMQTGHTGIFAGHPGQFGHGGCFGDEGYTHDVQCVIYEGPDTRFTGHEICFASNPHVMVDDEHEVNAVSVIDVTDKANPVLLGRALYEPASFSHQGWLTEDQRFWLHNDELLHLQDPPLPRGTHIIDMADLTAPAQIGFYESVAQSTDHNVFVKGRYLYQSNYSSGLRILDLRHVADADLTEVAYFDVYPPNDNPGFGFGTWNNYPYFHSGVVAVHGYQGLWLVKPRLGDRRP
jgi:hypothetical protein